MTLVPLYFAPAAWYAALLVADSAVIDTNVRYDRRYKDVHRCTIAGNGGDLSRPLTLTAAIVHDKGPAAISDIRLSDHDRWWEKHARSIATAYGRTPWFEHLWPEFAPLLNDSLPGTSLTALTLRIDAVIRRMLDITTPCSIPFADSWSDYAPTPVSSFRPPKYSDTPAAQAPSAAVSILDALFRLGPEATRGFLVSIAHNFH